MFENLLKNIRVNLRRLIKLINHFNANMKGIFELLLLVFTYRPSIYLQHYFNCHRLARDNPNEFQRKIHDPIRLLKVFMIWLAIRHVYFAIRYHHIRDQFWDVINSDMLDELGFDYWSNIFVAALVYQSYQFMNMLYLDNPTAQILDRILILRENRSFYYPYRYKQYVAVNFMVFIIKIWLYSIYIFKINVGEFFTRFFLYFPYIYGIIFFFCH